MSKRTYPLATSTWDIEEYESVNAVLNSGNFTMGQKVLEFEKEFAKFIGTDFALMVNSGSSANLVLIAALRYQKSSRFEPGDEFIVPAVSWSTTYYPIQQMGFSLKFVDIDPLTLNIDINKLQNSVSPKTKAIFAVNLLGNSCDFSELNKFCIDNNLVLIEDNCESLGAEFGGEKTGSLGFAGTHSFFFSHHICTMEGGMVTTNSKELYETMFSLRAHGWLRGLPKINSVANLSENEWEDQFKFALPGFNLRPLEIEAAAGLSQLRKFPKFLEMRIQNAIYFKSKFQNNDNFRIQKEIGRSSWFGFSIILQGNLTGHREQLLNHLAEEGVETRPIVSGNFLENPVMIHLPHSIHGEIEVASEIHANGFFVGNSHLDLRGEIDLFFEVLNEYISRVAEDSWEK